MIRETSIEAYHKIKAEGTLSQRRWEVYSTLYTYGPLTATGIAQRMQGYKSPSVGANVHARLCELRVMTVVKEIGIIACPHTNQDVHMYDVTRNLPVKLVKGLKPSPRELIRALCNQLETIAVKIKPVTKEGIAWKQKTESLLTECSKYQKQSHKEVRN